MSPDRAPTAPAIRVVIADDHPLILEAIRRRLDRAPDIEVVGEATDTDSLLAKLDALQPPADVAIVDVSMPPTNGLDATATIRSRHPRTEVVILTGATDPQIVLEGMRRGAKGYLLKQRGGDEIVDAVRLVARGHVIIDPDLTEAVALAGDPPSELTARGLELLQLVAQGRPNPEIVRLLHFSVGTVKSDLARVISKLGAHDRTSAVAQALRRRLIE